jgi:chemotaxis protein methyltransferase CheR
VQPVAAAFALPQANAEEIGQESAEAACEKGQSEEGSAPGPALTAYEEACALYTQGRYIEVTEKLLTQGRAKEREHDAVRNFCEQEMALLARAYANQGQLDSAQTWCERALAANKFDAKLHYLRATILLEQGQVAEARLSLTRALYLDQHFILAHFALGNLARQNREFKEAHKHFANAQALLEKCPSEGTLAESDGMTAGRLAQIIAEMTVRS